MNYDDWTFEEIIRYFLDDEVDVENWPTAALVALEIRVDAELQRRYDEHAND